VRTHGEDVDARGERRGAEAQRDGGRGTSDRMHRMDRIRGEEFQCGGVGAAGEDDGDSASFRESLVSSDRADYCETGTHMSQVAGSGMG
jgi:hypothetical protein